MLKEAASFNDVGTVDKVLALNFLTPENVSMFIEYLPEFEQTVEKLARLLVGVRTGMQSVPESAVKSAMERLDEVVMALKRLSFERSA